MLSLLRWTCPYNLRFLIPPKTIHASSPPLPRPIDRVSDQVDSPLDQVDSQFHRLPYEIVGTIFGKLCIGDRVRTRLVCKSWKERLMRADFPVEPEPPWLISFENSYTKTGEYSLKEMMWFESFSEDRMYRFKLPTSVSLGGSPWRWCCCASSSRGWLLMAGRSGPDLSSTVMLLWDPISGITRKLPGLSTLPFFGELVEDGIKIGFEDISSLIDGVQVFSAGSVECVVAVIFIVGDSDQYLALCTPLDQNWSVVDQDGGKSYIDTLSNNGKLYVWCDYNNNNNEVIEKSKCTVLLRCCDVEVIMLQLMLEDHRDQIIDYNDDDYFNGVGYNVRERWNRGEHLVESSKSGEFLVVSTILDLCSYNDNFGGQGPIPPFNCNQTRDFEVHRLKVDVNGLYSLEKMSHGVDQGIFLGAVGSTSVHGVEADCIHFAINDSLGELICSDDDDYYHGHGQEEEERRLIRIACENSYRVHERGVFNMRDNEINRTFVANFRVTSGSGTGWFTPKF